VDAPRKLRVGVLISGRGSNMAALIAAAATPGYPAEIALVISNRPDAGGLARAEAARVPTLALDHKAFSDRVAFDAQITAALEEAGVEFICLAGYMRLLSAPFVAHWHDRMINIHPSLLPNYKGLNTHARALEEGVRFNGCSVHFFRNDVDSGPIIAQAVVPIEAGDTPESLATRVIVEENRLYPHALALVASGRARVEGERMVFAPGVTDAQGAALFSPPLA
jgi:phosphoribosylglycinamide formyltransferase-1